MNKFVRSKIIAMTTATGITLAMSQGIVPPVTVNADGNIPDSGIDSLNQNASPQTIDEARELVNITKAAAEQAGAEAQAAQDSFNTAQSNLNTANSSLEAVRADAAGAFDGAKAAASEANQTAQGAVNTASENVAVAATAKESAEAEKTAAENDAGNAQANLSDVQSRNETVKSENDYEAETTRISGEIAAAQSAVDTATAAVDSARAQVASAEASAEQARANQDAAATAVAGAQAAYNSAQAQADAASAQAQAAQAALDEVNDLVNNEAAIQATAQYQAAQTALGELNQAQAAYNQASAEVANAEAVLANARTEEAAALESLNQAQASLAEKQAAYNEAVSAHENAVNARNNAQADFDDASSAAGASDKAVESAQSDVDAAQADVNTAIQNKDSADAQAAEATAAYNSAQQAAENSVNAEIAEKEAALALLEEEVEEALSHLQGIEDQYSSGMSGLIAWMLEQEDLSKVQLQDLQFADEVIMNAMDENLEDLGDPIYLSDEDMAARNGKVLSFGDLRDSTSLDNILKAIEIMKEINAKRASDENYAYKDIQPSYTNFYAVAVAQASAMREAAVQKHSTQLMSCENLCVGTERPVYWWYDDEKAVFDRYKEQLGITEITSGSQIARIVAAATQDGYVVGHYTNLFYNADQVMGVGYTDYFGTSVYNASSASSFRNDKKDKGMHLYTIDEFEALVLAYMATLDKDTAQAAYDDALSRRDEAQSALASLIANKAALIAEACAQENSQMTSALETAALMATALNSANEALTNAAAALESATAQKIETDAALAEATANLDAANTLVSEKESALNTAEETLETAGKILTAIEELVGQTKSAVADAETVLAEKQTILDQAGEVLEDKQTLYDEAAAELASLTSDERIADLTDKKNAADAALAEAQVALNDANDAMMEAADALEDALQTVADAENLVTDKKEALNNAISNAEDAQSTLGALEAESRRIDNEYEALKGAVTALKAANDALTAAGEKVAAAETALAEAQNTFEQAQSDKRAADEYLERASALSLDGAYESTITDPDFEYLNGYVDQIKNAEDAVAQAQTALDEAAATLEEKLSAKDKADKEYLAALAELAILEDQQEQDEHYALITVVDAANKVVNKGYTDSSWSRFRKALNNAVVALRNNYTYSQLSITRQNLESSKASLQLKKANTITGTSIYGVTGNVSASKTFNLNAKCVNGTPKFTSNNKYIAVNSKGKVTVAKNFCGSAMIKVTSPASDQYNTATKNVAVKVYPGQMKVSSAKSLSGRKIKVAWTKMTGAAKYEVQYSLSKSMKSPKKKTVSSANVTLSGLTKGRTYYVRIRAYNKALNKWGSWSAVKACKVVK